MSAIDDARKVLREAQTEIEQQFAEATMLLGRVERAIEINDHAEASRLLTAATDIAYAYGVDIDLFDELGLVDGAAPSEETQGEPS